MKKQDTEESAPQDSENATPATTEMESPAAVKDSPDGKSPEASEPQMPCTDPPSQSDEAVSEGKSLHFYNKNNTEGFCECYSRLSQHLQYFGKSLDAQAFCCIPSITMYYVLSVWDLFICSNAVKALCIEIYCV